MKHFTGTLTAVVGLGLLLTACVPVGGSIEGPSSAASPSVSEGNEEQPLVQTPQTDLPLQPYSADDLDTRVSKLPSSTVAYQVQEGFHPLDDAVAGSEQVLLAEDFSTSSRFALPGNSANDSLYIEIACSKATKYSLEVYDHMGIIAGSGTAAKCSSNQTGTLGFSPGGNLQLEQIQVAFDQETEGQLSLTVYTAQRDE